jgi:hypothetical protein
MHGPDRLTPEEALLVRGLLLLLRWVLGKFLPNTGIRDLEQGGDELLQAHNQFLQVMAAASSASPAAPAASSWAPSAGAAPSTPPASAAAPTTAPTGVTPAGSLAEPGPEPGSPTPVYATSGCYDRRDGRYHRCLCCAGFDKMASTSVIMPLPEADAQSRRLTRCQLCYSEVWKCRCMPRRVQ